MKSLFFLIILFISTVAAFSQPVISPHLDYSLKYQSGGGFDAGVKIQRSYVGVNTLVFFTTKRDVPAFINLQYGYSIGRFQPFISYGFYTAGTEAVKEHEGTRGFAPGGGLAYFFRYVPLKISSGITNNNFFFSISAIVILDFGRNVSRPAKIRPSGFEDSDDDFPQEK
jgi:hypothetical protein